MARIGSRRSFLETITRREREILRAYFQTANDIRAAVTYQRVSNALEEGDLIQVGELLVTRAALTDLLERFRDAYIEGGQEFARAIPRGARNPAGDRLLFRFDVMNTRAQTWLAQTSSEFVTNVSGQQIEAIREVVTSGTRLGRNPRQTALDIVGRVSPITGRREGGIVLMTGDQARWAANAREQLLSGDPEQMRAYLRRQRRDKRFDSAVKRAIREGRAVGAAQTERIVARYSDRLLQLRGETIARTEAIKAYATGRHEGMLQLVQDHAIPAETITRTWDATLDDATRPDHVAMDGTAVQGPDEPFELPDHSLMMHPLDSSLNAPVEQIINCRCYESIEVDFIEVQALALESEAF